MAGGVHFAQSGIESLQTPRKMGQGLADQKVEVDESASAIALKCGSLAAVVPNERRAEQRSSSRDRDLRARGIKEELSGLLKTKDHNARQRHRIDSKGLSHGQRELTGGVIRRGDRRDDGRGDRGVGCGLRNRGISVGRRTIRCSHRCARVGRCGIVGRRDRRGHGSRRNGPVVVRRSHWEGGSR